MFVLGFRRLKIFSFIASYNSSSFKRNEFKRVPMGLAVNCLLQWTARTGYGSLDR